MGDLAPLVLVVDDDDDVSEFVADALSNRGYRTQHARNGLEALQRIAETEPQLILLDMRMPVMDGWTFAATLREQYGRRIPLVVVTAAEDSKLRADDVGANADLGKPFDLARLYEVVEDTIGAPGGS